MPKRDLGKFIEAVASWLGKMQMKTAAEETAEKLYAMGLDAWGDIYALTVKDLQEHQPVILTHYFLLLLHFSKFPY